MSEYPPGFLDWPEEKRRAFFKGLPDAFEGGEKAKATANGEASAAGASTDNYGPDIVSIDLSLGEDWQDREATQDHVEPAPISAEAYFDLPDEEKREVDRDSRGLPIGYWSLWPQEARNRYGRENPRAPNAGPLRERIEVNSEAFSRNGAAPQKKQKPPSRVTGAGAFMRTYMPISYTVEGLLPSGFFYAMTARTGAGKTAFAQAVTFAVTMNRPAIIGAEVAPGRVAYVTFENPTDFKMKLAVGCYVHGISWDEIDPRLAVIEGRDTPEQILKGLKLDAKANGSFQHVNIDTLQAGFSAAGAGKFNDNESILAYIMRLRPLTELPGQPSLLLLCHPTKDATEDNLQPYGGGATVNEIDGNLTLWKAAQIKLHHTDKLRGPTFEPKYFRIEHLSCPDILDTKGRQIALPVMRPCTEADASEREKNDGNLDLALLRAMAANPDGTQLEWALAIGVRSKGSISRKLQKLKTMKLIEERLGGKWRLTPKGQREAAQ